MGSNSIQPLHVVRMHWDIHFICATCPGSGVSTASTLPADEDEARRLVKASLVKAAMETFKTPSPKDKGHVETASVPKTRHDDGHVARSPTQYYSPSKGDRSRRSRKVAQVPEIKATAVKACPKPPKKTVDKNGNNDKKDTSDKSNKKKTKQDPGQQEQVQPQAPKQEPVPTATAVSAALHRASTVDIHNGPPPASPGDSDDDESGSSSEAGGDQNDDDDNQERPGEDGLSAEHVRQKKAAHARYMRFSRSLQSTSAAICMIDILIIGYHADDLSMLCVCVRACAYYQNRSFQTRQGINQTCANIACRKRQCCWYCWIQTLQHLDHWSKGVGRKTVFISRGPMHRCHQ